MSASATQGGHNYHHRATHTTHIISHTFLCH